MLYPHMQEERSCKGPVTVLGANPGNILISDGSSRVGCVQFLLCQNCSSIDETNSICTWRSESI